MNTRTRNRNLVFVLVAVCLIGVIALLLSAFARNYAEREGIPVSQVPANLRSEIFKVSQQKEASISSVGVAEQPAGVEPVAEKPVVEELAEESPFVVVEKGPCNEDIIVGWRTDQGAMTIALGVYDYAIVSTDPGQINGQIYNYGVILVSQVDLEITEVGWNEENGHFNTAACLYEGGDPLMVLAYKQDQEGKPTIGQIDEEGNFVNWSWEDLVDRTEYNYEAMIKMAMDGKEAICDKRLNPKIIDQEAENLIFAEPPSGWIYKGSADESSFNGTFFPGGLTFISKDALEVEELPWLVANERWGMHICMIPASGVRNELLEIQARELKPNPVLFYNGTYEVVGDFLPENLKK